MQNGSSSQVNPFLLNAYLTVDHEETTAVVEMWLHLSGIKFGYALYWI